MIDEKICNWLVDNADTPIRYRVARELLKDKKSAKRIEKELTENPIIMRWLKHLKPETPAQHHSMEHGSFDFCLENAILKLVQLGLHSEFSQLTNAITYYIVKIESVPFEFPVRNRDFHKGFACILISNLLSLTGLDNDAINNFMLLSLNEIYDFVCKDDYNIYYSEEEKRDIPGIPSIWKNRKIITRNLITEYGFCYPLLYDIVGLHTLYKLKDERISHKIQTIINYISTDLFHNTIADEYGIIPADDKKFHSMGWDPKFPGWFSVEKYLENNNVPKLLFFAQYIAKYPNTHKTKWFHDFINYLDRYRTDNGTYIFPAAWLQERQGYAVMGSHLSFGENRRKSNWREIESTFFVQQLKSSV